MLGLGTCPVAPVPFWQERARSGELDGRLAPGLANLDWLSGTQPLPTTSLAGAGSKDSLYPAHMSDFCPMAEATSARSRGWEAPNMKVDATGLMGYMQSRSEIASSCLPGMRLHGNHS